LVDARRVIAAAEDKSPEIGQPMNIAVVDAGGILVSHVGMDGASRTRLIESHPRSCKARQLLARPAAAPRRGAARLQPDPPSPAAAIAWRTPSTFSQPTKEHTPAQFKALWLAYLNIIL
jgi:hypothetical protein